MNEKELHPRQVLAKLSTDPVIENLEKWRTDRNYVAYRQPTVPNNRFNSKRLVSVACATLGLLLIAPSATSVFAEPIQKQLGESLPIAPSQIETDQSPIQQPEKPEKDFQLQQRLKEVEKKTTDLVPSVPVDEFKPPAEDSDRSAQNDQPVNQSVNNKPVNEQPAPPQQNHDEKTIDPVVTVKPHSSSSAAIDQKPSHKTFHHVSQVENSKSFQNVSVTKAKEKVDNQTPAEQPNAKVEKDTVVVETVSAKAGNRENIPTTQDTPLPKTASSDPAKAAAGLGLALLGVAWKTRRYGQA